MKEKVVKKLATATLVSGAMLLAANKQSTVQAAGLNVKDNSNEAQSEEQKAQQPEVTKDQAQADVNKAQSERDEAKSQVNEAQRMQTMLIKKLQMLNHKLNKQLKLMMQHKSYKTSNS